RRGEERAARALGRSTAVLSKRAAGERRELRPLLQPAGAAREALAVIVLAAHPGAIAIEDDERRSAAPAPPARLTEGVRREGGGVDGRGRHRRSSTTGHPGEGTRTRASSWPDSRCQRRRRAGFLLGAGGALHAALTRGGAELAAAASANPITAEKRRPTTWAMTKATLTLPSASARPMRAPSPGRSSPSTSRHARSEGARPTACAAAVTRAPATG